LILGYGSIGREIAERLRPFGVSITGVRRSADGEPGVIGPDDWRPRLAEFDWVIVTTPLTAATRHLVGAAEIAAMRPTARLVNMARGGIVDEHALAEALRGGRLGGAYLDVTEQEPLPAESELWEVPDLILTPHSSGMSHRSDERAAARFLANLARYRAGEPLQDLVDLELGY
jgi:phosphoglycerate dehydrogenase-like enzyme